MPPTAYNRVADNWRPLFAIAHIAGADWPRLALEAYNHLANHGAKAAPRHSLSVGGEGQGEVACSPHSAISNPQSGIVPPSQSQIALLAAIRQIFTEAAVTRISSKQLVASLRALPDPFIVHQPSVIGPLLPLLFASFRTSIYFRHVRQHEAIVHLFVPFPV